MLQEQAISNTYSIGQQDPASDKPDAATVYSCMPFSPKRSTLAFFMFDQRKGMLFL